MADESRQDSDENPNCRDSKGRFAPGNPGGPGRPKGLRDALEYDFINAVQREFAKRGVIALAALAPKEFCDVAVRCLPKESRMEVGEHFADLLMRAADVLAKRGT